MDSQSFAEAELAQSVERTTLNRVVVGSIPTFGASSFVLEHACALSLQQVRTIHLDL